MTRKLYDEMPYATDFTATVLECTKEKDLYKVLLDQTLFFPEEGGQSPDKGTINGAEVLDVKIKNNEVFHYVKEEMTIGDGVVCTIDFAHRFRNMQMHSGEHIFSGLVYKLYGYNNVGFHLSDNDAHMDYDGKFSDEDIERLERLANRVIVSNVEIITSYPSKDELANINYRSKKELSGPIRIVEIPDTDICACCAPHVKRTGEIGIFKVISHENYKGGTRIVYLCGSRAIEDYEKRLKELKNISVLLSAKPYEEDEKVKNLFEEAKDLRFNNTLLKNTIMEFIIEHNYTGNANGIIVLAPDESSGMKFALDILHKYYTGRCIVLCGDDESGYRYMIESYGEDLSGLSERLKTELNAKGGGRKECIQGNVFGKLDSITQIVL